MFSNLYKAGFVHLGEDARVIDMNAILEKRLKEEAERRSRQPEHELVAAQDGFTEGKCEIIHLMFDAGESLEKIAQYTGYKVEELKNLLSFY